MEVATAMMMQRPQTAVDLKRRLDRLFCYMGAKNYHEGAELLGVRPWTLSRWINSKHAPSQLALHVIAEAERKYIPQEET